MKRPEPSIVLIELDFEWEEYNDTAFPEEKHDYEYVLASGPDDFVGAVRDVLWPVMQTIYNADQSSPPWEPREDTVPDPVPDEPVFVTEDVAHDVDADVVMEFDAQAIGSAFLTHPKNGAWSVGKHPMRKTRLVETAENIMEDYDPNPSERVDTSEYTSLDAFE